MDDFATGYIAGQGDNNNSSNGMWGDGGWIFGIIILAMVFGWGRGGFGGFGGFGGGASDSPGLQGLATRADVNEAIAFNGVERGIQGIQQGICDSTYALNNSITSGSASGLQRRPVSDVQYGRSGSGLLLPDPAGH